MEIKEVYEQYFNTVYGYLCTLTGGNYDLAEELTQETFYRATKKISEFRGECKISTWLCQIAKYVYYQSLDKKRRSKEVPFDEAVEIAMHEEVQKSIEDAEAKLHIYKVIHALPSPMRDVVMLKLTGELSFKEIGNVLGQSENWARVTFYRAKQILGKELKKDEQ
ncbi:MAG: sigma-70 family RNA polymerase sigma factor [Lachnospiraceae bacterium]|nr:sigma-70 family RNA polymerase sigma factor [Lachnospiraceae bacterium]